MAMVFMCVGVGPLDAARVGLWLVFADPATALSTGGCERARRG
jgi:hypothetical protein